MELLISSSNLLISPMKLTALPVFVGPTVIGHTTFINMQSDLIEN